MNNNNKIQKKFGKFVVKGTEKQVNEIYDTFNKERYWSETAVKYFHVYISLGSGVFMFPKRQYFVSWNNITDYRKAFEKFTGASLDAFEN